MLQIQLNILGIAVIYNIMIDSLSPDLVSCMQAIYSHGGGKTQVFHQKAPLYWFQWYNIPLL